MRVHGRNGTFDLHETYVSGATPGLCFIDLLARKSSAKNVPVFLQGTKAELIEWLKNTMADVEKIGELSVSGLVK